MTVRGGLAVAAMTAVAATAGAQSPLAAPRPTFVRDLIRAAVAQTARSRHLRRIVSTHSLSGRGRAS
jgi:hypothetical protein